MFVYKHDFAKKSGSSDPSLIASGSGATNGPLGSEAGKGGQGHRVGARVRAGLVDGHALRRASAQPSASRFGLAVWWRLGVRVRFAEQLLATRAREADQAPLDSEGQFRLG